MFIGKTPHHRIRWDLVTRIIIAGPPASGKSNLAKAVAEHFKVSHTGLTRHTW